MLRSFMATLVVASTFTVINSAPARAQTTYTLGIDVSHHQGAIDWSQVAQSGHVFVFQKATEGATFTDQTYASNRSGAAGVGLYFGAYHFARPDGATSAAVQADARAEADHFLAVAQPAPGDLLPVLDLEASGGLSSTLLVEWTQTWIDHVRAAVGSRVLIYSGPNFWRTSMGDTDVFALQSIPLWLAHYTSASSPSVPAANWGNSGWSFWQWTNCASIPGIAGCVDENRFAGSDLSSFKIPGAPGPEPTTTPASPPTNQTPPLISGDPEVGSTLSASTGAWAGSQPQSYSFAWHRCIEGTCSATGGTSPTYEVVPADEGKQMKVTVTATNSAGSATAHSSLSSTVTDPTPSEPPTITEPARRFSLDTRIDVAWTHPELGLVTFDVRYRLATPFAAPGGQTQLTTGTSDTSATLRSRAGSTYCFSARAVDDGGQASAWSVPRCATVPLDDRDLAESEGWSSTSNSRFYLGTSKETIDEGAILRTGRVRFQEVRLVAERCAGCGQISVVFKGSVVATIDLRSKRTVSRRIIEAVRFNSVRKGRLKLVVASDGKPVRIDGLALT